MIFIKKDLTTVKQGIILNGVNCQRAMGAGLAKSLYLKWPIVREQFRNTEPRLGKVDYVLVDKELIVANCYTQERYGYNGVYASLEGISYCLDLIGRVSKATDFAVYTSKLGCGLGGLDWEDVEPLFEEVEKKYNIKFHICELE